jgi:hypothetical protein
MQYCRPLCVPISARTKLSISLGCNIIEFIGMQLKESSYIYVVL